MTTLMEQIVTVTGTLIPAPKTVLNIGEVVAFVPQGATPGDEAFTIATSADVADLLDATNITEDSADALNFMLAQNIRPPYIRVVTYVTTDVVGAFAVMKAQSGWNPGYIYFRGLNDVAGDLEDVYDFANAAENKWLYYYEIESPNTGLYGGSKPAALEDIEAIETAGVTYVADDVTGTANGGAFTSIIGGRVMVGVGGAPLASRVSIAGGADVAALTSTQWANLVANDAKAVIQLDAGSSSSERIMHGVDAYAGNGFTPVTSFVLTVRLARLGIKELIQRMADLGLPILASPAGVAMTEQAVFARIYPMFEAKHFLPNTDYPLGFSVKARVVGDQILTDVFVRLTREVRSFTLNNVGEIV